MPELWLSWGVRPLSLTQNAKAALPCNPTPALPLLVIAALSFCSVIFCSLPRTLTQAHGALGQKPSPPLPSQRTIQTSLLGQASPAWLLLPLEWINPSPFPYRIVNQFSSHSDPISEMAFESGTIPAQATIPSCLDNHTSTLTGLSASRPASPHPPTTFCCKDLFGGSPTGKIWEERDCVGFWSCIPSTWHIIDAR